MKNIIDYIVESQKFLIKGHIKAQLHKDIIYYANEFIKCNITQLIGKFIAIFTFYEIEDDVSQGQKIIHVFPDKIVYNKQEITNNEFIDTLKTFNGIYCYCRIVNKTLNKKLVSDFDEIKNYSINKDFIIITSETPDKLFNVLNDILMKI